MVKRVSERVGRGVTLRLALDAEENPKINEETWKKALAAHPDLSPHYEAAKGKFISAAVERLVGHENPKWLCWLLQKRHPDLFGDPGDGGTTVNVSQTVAVGGIPEDILQRSREIAAEAVARAAVKPGPKKGPHGH